MLDIIILVDCCSVLGSDKNQCTQCFVHNVLYTKFPRTRGGRIGRIVMVVVHVKSAQIQEQEAEPQQIVAQRLLSCLQYPVPIKSSTEDLT